MINSLMAAGSAFYGLDFMRFSSIGTMKVSPNFRGMLGQSLQNYQDTITRVTELGEETAKLISISTPTTKAELIELEKAVRLYLSLKGLSPDTLLLLSDDAEEALAYLSLKKNVQKQLDEMKQTFWNRSDDKENTPHFGASWQPWLHG